MSDEETTKTPALASELDRLGAEWQDRGEWGKALSCYRKALKLWRALAASDAARYTGKLYDSLLALGYFRIVMGEPEEGIGHWEEMLVVNRGLVERGELTESTLAYNLSMYGFMLERVRRIKDSLDAHLEALDSYRRLARQDRTYLSGLAKCLNTVGSRYAALNRVPEGVRYVLEAITTLASQQELHEEERLACVSDFLFNLAHLYRRTGEHAKAAVLCEEAVERARELAAAGSVAGRAQLAGNTERFGVFLIREGRPAEAEAPLAEAADLYTGLASMTPKEYNARLAGALLNLGEVLVRLDRPEEALDRFARAAEAYARLAEEDTYAYTGKLLTSLCRLGDAAGRLGHRDVVNAAYAKALLMENRYIRRYGLTFAPFVEDSFEKLLAGET